MRKLACFLLLAAGCEKTDPNFCRENPGASGCATNDDADVADDAEIIVDMDPGIDAQQCFGTGTYSLCLTAAPMVDVVLNPGDFDTDSTNTACLTAQPTEWVGAGQPDACFIVGKTISVSTLNVIGDRPLVLLAATNLTITGLVDAASHRQPSKLGPASPFSACGSFTDDPADSTGGSGGGAGGTFTTVGGNGGRGGTAADSGGTAIAANPIAPTLLRAGCPGQDGGDGEGNGGGAGRGGGAIVLMAGGMITLGASSVVNASGSSASIADESGGGGGGGSGGMIVLNAPNITVAAGAKLLANGGGGSSGASDANNCGGCTAGSDPTLDPAVAALGGTGGGGNGGKGYASMSGGSVFEAENGVGNSGSGVGGGGGGGGAGFIQTTSALTGIIASPEPIVVP